MHTYETSEIKLYVLKNGSEPIQSVNKKLHILNKSFYLLKKDYMKKKLSSFTALEIKIKGTIINKAPIEPVSANNCNKKL